VWFKGADHADALFGEDVYAAVIDEATRVKEEAWHAVRSTLTATEGPIRIIGNVKGRRNWAYHLARKAQGGAPNMAYAKMTCHDAVQAGFLTTEEVDDARHQLPDAVFRELYMAEPSRRGRQSVWPDGHSCLHRPAERQALGRVGLGFGEVR